MSRHNTTIVSYVGKFNFQEAEPYIWDNRMWSYLSGDLLVEITTTNGEIFH